MITANDPTSTAAERLGHGATDGVGTPFEFDELQIVPRKVWDDARLRREVVRLRREMRDLREEISKIAGHDARPNDQQASQEGAIRNRFPLPAGGISLQEVEQAFVQQALAAAGGNQGRAARLVGLERDAFHRRLKKYGLR